MSRSPAQNLDTVDLMGGMLRMIDQVVKRVLRLRLVRAFLLYSDHRGGLLAAAITFRMLFAVFAAVLLGFSAVTIWLSARSDLVDALIETVNDVVPGLLEVDGQGLIDVSAATQFGADNVIAGVVSVLALVWALVSAVGNLRMSIRTIAGTRHENSNALIMRAFDLLFALSIGVLLIASAAATFLGTAFVDSALEWLGVTQGGVAEVLTRAGTVFATFVLDAVVIAWLFWLQSGMKMGVRTMLPGVLVGAAGLVLLQQASSLFVGGADNNPLLKSSASLIALLLWFNFSAQVVLIASAYIVVTVEEQDNRVAERYGAENFHQRRVRAAERDVRVADDALRAARAEERAAREKAAERSRRLAARAERRGR
ncbi:YihY/virulence factor BrkB family protein [Microbacterium suaedae]|uniref:YihY/virulence factor BrkB family protein n=1 Tax=Microbacterium suaedae TaxID=2067813 RepID=UPI0013A66FC2|nr:YihY/virulence factor BrkB family protein [Microbacterium suaedae]